MYPQQLPKPQKPLEEQVKVLKTRVFELEQDVQAHKKATGYAIAGMFTGLAIVVLIFLMGWS